jgi:hypothetical protein
MYKYLLLILLFDNLKLNKIYMFVVFRNINEYHYKENNNNTY